MQEISPSLKPSSSLQLSPRLQLSTGQAECSAVGRGKACEAGGRPGLAGWVYRPSLAVKIARVIDTAYGMHEQAMSVKSKNHIIFACQDNLAYIQCKVINGRYLVLNSFYKLIMGNIYLVQLLRFIWFYHCVMFIIQICLFQFLLPI